MNPNKENSKSASDIIGAGRMVGKTCQCGASFQVKAGLLEHLQKNCPRCCQVQHEAVEAIQKREREQRRLDNWIRLCPPELARTKRELLPNPKKLDEVLRWEFGKKGLLLSGDPSKGKSRCAWQLLAREYAAGRSIISLNPLSGLYYATTYSDAPEAVWEWCQSLIRRDILLMDDVFKNKLTDSFEGVVFAIIDQRMMHCRPIIYTTNDTGETLMARMSRDRGEAMLWRIWENCSHIQF